MPTRGGAAADQQGLTRLDVQPGGQRAVGGLQHLRDGAERRQGRSGERDDLPTRARRCTRRSRRRTRGPCRPSSRRPAGRAASSPPGRVHDARGLDAQHPREGHALGQAEPGVELRPVEAERLHPDQHPAGRARGRAVRGSARSSDGPGRVEHHGSHRHDVASCAFAKRASGSSRCSSVAMMPSSWRSCAGVSTSMTCRRRWRRGPGRRPRPCPAGRGEPGVGGAAVLGAREAFDQAAVLEAGARHGRGGAGWRWSGAASAVIRSVRSGASESIASTKYSKWVSPASRRSWVSSTPGQQLDAPRPAGPRPPAARRPARGRPCAEPSGIT